MTKSDDSVRFSGATVFDESAGPYLRACLRAISITSASSSLSSSYGRACRSNSTWCFFDVWSAKSSQITSSWLQTSHCGTPVFHAWRNQAAMRACRGGVVPLLHCYRGPSPRCYVKSKPFRRAWSLVPRLCPASSKLARSTFKHNYQNTLLQCLYNVCCL